MNAIDLLKSDHRELQKLMKKVEKSSEKAIATRKKLFEQIKINADVHEKAEEKYFYPPLSKGNRQQRKNSLEHQEEVKIMSRLLKELSHTDLGTEEWTAKFAVFKELTDHHIEEEEEEFFPEAKKVLTKEQLTEIGEEIAEYKSRTIK